MGGSPVRISMWLLHARRDVKGPFKGLRPHARRCRPTAAVIRQATGTGPASPSHCRRAHSQRTARRPAQAACTTRRVAHRSGKPWIVNAIAVFPMQGAIGYIVPLSSAMPAMRCPDSKPARSPWVPNSRRPAMSPDPPPFEIDAHIKGPPRSTS